MYLNTNITFPTFYFPLRRQVGRGLKAPTHPGGAQLVEKASWVELKNY
jgi:hypothetical protein